MNVFVLDYFSPEVTVPIFSSQKNMLLSVLDLYIVLINDWNDSKLEDALLLWKRVCFLM